MAVWNVSPCRGVEQIAALLDSPEIAGLIKNLQETRWTGRPGYPIRAMVGLALVKSVYVLPTWSRAVRLVAEHAAYRMCSVARGRLPWNHHPPLAQARARAW